MKMELSSYFQQSLSKHQEIDRRLQPLLHIIKQNKINSIHQLASQTVDHSTLDARVLSTLSKPSLKKANLRKFYSEYDKSQEKPKTSGENNRVTPRKYASKSANENRKQPADCQPAQADQPMVYRGPHSKIKKHLIESMRFENLEALIHKDSKSNRFKEFISSLEKKRNASQQRKMVSLYRLEKVRLVDNEQANQIFQSSSKTNEDSLFKVKIRKRFWKKDKYLPKEKANLGNVLCIRGMKNMAITIE